MNKELVGEIAGRLGVPDAVESVLMSASEVLKQINESHPGHNADRVAAALALLAMAYRDGLIDEVAVSVLKVLIGRQSKAFALFFADTEEQA